MRPRRPHASAQRVRASMAIKCFEDPGAAHQTGGPILARKQSYSFQRRERDASKRAKRVAKEASRHGATEPGSASSEEPAAPPANEVTAGEQVSS